MPIESYDIAGSYNNQRYTSIDAERTVNMFQYNDAFGKKDKSLIFTSGLQESGITFVRPDGTAQPGAFRASFAQGNFHYHVIGDGVYIVNTSDVASRLGVLTTSAGYVGIEANQTQIIFVDGAKGYIWGTTNLTFTEITDTSFPVNPLDVCYLDGLFAVISGNTNQFQLSQINQGLVWGPSGNAFTTNIGGLPNQLIIGASTIGGVGGTSNYQTGVSVTLTTTGGGSLAGSGLAVATTYYTIFVDATHIKLATTVSNALAGTPITLTGDVSAPVQIISTGQLQLATVNSHPGTLVACRTLHRRIFFFSQNFTEVWENSGIGSNLPFRRNNSLLMEYGCAAIGSVIAAFDKLFFLSQDRGGLGAVMEVIGTEAIPVSTRALDFQLSQYLLDSPTGVSDARSILIKDNGLIFFRLNFTQSNHTYVYNVTLSNPMSDETKYWNEEEVLNGDRHPAQTQVFFMGDNYYGDYRNSNLYFVSPDYLTNNGESIRRMRIGKAITVPTYQRLRIDRFQLDLIQGTVFEQSVLDNVFPILTEEGQIISAENDNFLITESTFQNNSGISITSSNPVCFLSYSKDGGRTYGNKLRGPMGKIGQRTFRTVWRKLGVVPRGQGFVPKIEFFSQLPFVILGASWFFDILPE